MIRKNSVTFEKSVSSEVTCQSYRYRDAQYPCFVSNGQSNDPTLSLSPNCGAPNARDKFQFSCVQIIEKIQHYVILNLCSERALGPCELQDPGWAKMNSLSGANKRRKKSETKPQAQINKCNNEKRRREQENIYIEELAELISANFADMSSLSVKPDKCAILQETVNQIRNIKQQENAVQSSDPVQQGEVSSSRPTILSNEVFGPLLLEALEGFLFVVNSEGRVEQVTENVTNYIKFTKEDILGKSIYNFIHHGDHAKFSSSLLPMSIAWGNELTNKSRSFTIRLLVKPLEDVDETVEEKQQRLCQYEWMNILSAPLVDQLALGDEEGGDNGPCLLCVASRISHKDKTITDVEQFTTKLDTSGKIIGVDTSGVSPAHCQFISKDLTNRVFKELVAPQDVHKLVSHLKETLTTGQAPSVLYRLQFGPDKFIQVQTKSKLFKTSSHASESDFVMATHTILGESDSLGPSDPGGGNSNSSLGGPLMTSAVNGSRNTAPVGVGSDNSTTSSTNTLLNTTSATYTTFNIDNDFNFDMFPSSTWELDSTSWQEPRPESRQSNTPVSTPTPRPPSNPAFSPVTSLAQSPMASFVAQPSPTIPNPPTPANSYNNNFSFSPITEQNYAMEEQKDSKVNVLEEATSMMSNSTKLRSLLSKPPNTPVVDSANDNDSRNKNRILKGLLNQQDDDDCRNDNRTSPRGLVSRGAMPGTSGTAELAKNSNSMTAGRNNAMLLELLNDKSDDDDLEARSGVKKKSELLEHLLKTERNDEGDDKKDQSHDDTLLRSLGFTSSPSPPGSRKRPSDGEDSASKRSNSDGAVTSSGSELCRRNRMLVSLLAKQSPNPPQPIPPIPASVLHATPQEKLPKIVDPNLTKNLNNRTVNSQTLQQQQVQQVQQQLQQQVQQQQMMNNRLTRMPSRPQTSYLNAMLSPQNNMQQRNDNRLSQALSGGCYTSPNNASSLDNNNSWSENNNIQSSNDPDLSEILDQVMDIVPDSIMQILELDPQHNSYQNSEISEKMAINIIQNSLMQMESLMKKPASPNVSISGTPPAYSSVTLSNQNSQNRGFPPPPNYPQQGYKIGQRVVRNPNYPLGGTAINPQQLLIHQQRKAMAQQQEKKRLLQQQQQQQLLIPPNATAAEINSGIQNIDSLLNNTVAPNVTLQRSSSIPEPQSSPNYNQITQASRVSNQQQFSPHSQLTSPIQQNFQQSTAGNFQQNTARLSPQSAFNQQHSPRQAYPQGTAPNANWAQQARLAAQNPMLNAQLTRAPQQRTMNSPGNRHSPFSTDSFPPPTSPNSVFTPNQYLRGVQRTNNTPTATTHLPGGLGSPRPYGRADHHPHPYSSIPPQPPSHHPMMYQQDAQYCYDQTGLHLAYNGADRGRAPPHLHPGVSGSGPTSEFVRQELRAVVGARTQGQAPQQNRQAPQQQILTQQQQVADLEVLGLTYESEYYGRGSAR
ncbi:nuclear receptor coactivator 2 isoform X4 [Coccinella septempunctata]|uniref:nuclear receptor coactivator 2 isoform X4 n=1 Tax=Coccinella septempunctata TaxID=41139 RepID=UPI001D0876C1|nr:nuclear receptor coactivator 2 isoform X4 [Coccinella septempunctata]